MTVFNSFMHFKHWKVVNTAHSLISWSRFYSVKTMKKAKKTKEQLNETICLQI